jgi:hypothetical protein
MFRHAGVSISVAILLSISVVSAATLPPPSNDHHASLPNPQPAIPVILNAFNKYEVVAIPAGHRRKDVDDLILNLIRDPHFSQAVNDVVVECGNSLYQPTLDRYTAGENVSFDDVKAVWRNTTQPNCGIWGFYEQLFPLIRAINQKLPAERRIRIVAADPPIDWNRILTKQDAINSVEGREKYIASVMESQVLSKNRKALMLFGELHLLHNSEGPSADAVSIYEKHYPNRTFVIAGLGLYGEADSVASQRMASWPSPSLVSTQGTTLGALTPDHFFLPSLHTDDKCTVHADFVDIRVDDPVARFVDAFLYLGPPDFNLREPIPSDIALDVAYIKEIQRREALMDIRDAKTVEEFDSLQISQAGQIFETVPKIDLKQLYPSLQKRCLDRKGQSPHGF